MAELIDAHHHLWQYTPEEFGWINDEMEHIRRDFLPADLIQELDAAGLDGSVVVQARQDLSETSWLLACAEQTPEIRGVVGWLPLAEPRAARLLQEFRGAPLLKGLRHVVQDEPDPNFLLDKGFNAGIAALLDTGLVYDLLIFSRHLPVAREFVLQHPQQVFVLDHLAKPQVRAQDFQSWADDLARLAACSNVSCKLSGLVTEADWTCWTPEQVRPYLDHALSVFGPQRLLAGSDWPVCLVASTYKRWWSTLMEWAADLPVEAREAIFGGNASRVYRLTAHAQAF